MGAQSSEYDVSYLEDSTMWREMVKKKAIHRKKALASALEEKFAK